MKATCSIIIAILVATSKIGSTFAQAAAANPDSATTSASRPVLINVVANDFTAAGVRATSATVVTVVTQPVIMMGTGNGVTGAGLASMGGAGGTILYTPAAGFTGMVTFTYSIPITGPPTPVPSFSPSDRPSPSPSLPPSRWPSPSPSDNHSRSPIHSPTNPPVTRRARRTKDTNTLTGTVTVTVLAREIRPVYKIENQFSTDSALATVNLSNLRKGSFNNDAFEAIRLAANGGV
jgi:hypothetical protein